MTAWRVGYRVSADIASQGHLEPVMGVARSCQIVVRSWIRSSVGSTSALASVSRARDRERWPVANEAPATRGPTTMPTFEGMGTVDSSPTRVVGVAAIADGRTLRSPCVEPSARVFALGHR